MYKKLQEFILCLVKMDRNRFEVSFFLRLTYIEFKMLYNYWLSKQRTTSPRSDVPNNKIKHSLLAFSSIKIDQNRQFPILSGNYVAFAATKQLAITSTRWPARAAKAFSVARSKLERNSPARTAKNARSAARTGARARVVDGTNASAVEWRKNASCPTALSKKKRK